MIKRYSVETLRYGHKNILFDHQNFIQKYIDWTSQNWFEKRFNFRNF